MSTTRGMIGEFITCAAIMSLSQGWRVIHCPQDQQDIIAHCFLDARRVVFYAAESVNQYSQRYSQSYPLRPDLEQESWDKAIAIIQERQI